MQGPGKYRILDSVQDHSARAWGSSSECMINAAIRPARATVIGPWGLIGSGLASMRIRLTVTVAVTALATLVDTVTATGIITAAGTVAAMDTFMVVGTFMVMGTFMVVAAKGTFMVMIRVSIIICVAA